MSQQDAGDYTRSRPRPVCVKLFSNDHFRWSLLILALTGFVTATHAETVYPVEQSLISVQFQQNPQSNDTTDRLVESAGSAPIENHEPALPELYLAILGHDDHGKTTTLAALSMVAAERHGGEAKTYEQINRQPQTREQRLSISTTQVSLKSHRRLYSLTDAVSHNDVVKNLIVSQTRLDGAILVVSAVDGPMPQTREHIKLARQAGVPSIVVYLNKVDLVDDAELLELVEMEVRELLTLYQYPGDDTPIIFGSALKALAGDDRAMGKPSIIKLLGELDRYIQRPVLPVDQAFLMSIEDVFSITGRGTIVTGRVERGVINVNDNIEIVGINATVSAECTGIEMFRKRLDQGKPGDNVGVLLRGISRDAVTRGQVLAKPGSISPHTRFAAQVYVMSKEEGGRSKPFFNGYRPQFYFRTTDVTGTVRLLEGVEMVMPGDNIDMEITLISSIAMQPGLRFAIREGGRTIGIGIVTKIIDQETDQETG